MTYKLYQNARIYRVALTWFNLLYVLGPEVQTFYEVAEISQ